jgi:hypothetical protein
MHVNLILHPDHASWIIEKMAQRVVDHAPQFGFSAAITAEPDEQADINHWMSYAFANERTKTPSSMFITHVDDSLKLNYVKRALKERVDLGICMSSYTVAELSHRGIPSASLCYVLPGHDNQVIPRRIVVGFTTRLYRDGRKREQLLLRLAQEIQLDAFCFEIHGAGWEKIVSKLADAGAKIRYYPGTNDYIGDYDAMLKAIPEFDYYVYLGLDEGSLGTLDALAAGVATIITPQGFHVDLPDGISHRVWDYHELHSVFAKIVAERDGRIASVKSLSWERHVERHGLIWRSLLDGGCEQVSATLAEELNSVPTAEQFRMVSDSEMSARSRSVRRTLTALGRHPIFNRLRSVMRDLFRRQS